jgi:hypothetical protein
MTKVERKIASRDTIMVSKPKRVVLDAQEDPGSEPDDVEVDEQHRAGEAGDLVGDAVLQALAPLVGVPEQRRIHGQGKRPGAHTSSFGLSARVTTTVVLPRATKATWPLAGRVRRR